MRPVLSSLFLGLVLSLPVFAAPAVSVVEDAPWSPDDAPRDGAAELNVLVQLAQLQRHADAVGLVGVGDRRGIFQDGTQRALEFAVRQGVPVVRLARGVPPCAPGANDVFIDGGLLSPEAAADLLAECLHRYGALPRNQSLDTPSLLTAREARAFREKLRLYQAEFTSRQPPLVAMR